MNGQFTRWVWIYMTFIRCFVLSGDFKKDQHPGVHIYVDTDTAVRYKNLKLRMKIDRKQISEKSKYEIWENFIRKTFKRSQQKKSDLIYANWFYWLSQENTSVHHAIQRHRWLHFFYIRFFFDFPQTKPIIKITVFLAQAILHYCQQLFDSLAKICQFWLFF